MRGLVCGAVPAGWSSNPRSMALSLFPCPSPLADGVGAPVSSAWVSPVVFGLFVSIGWVWFCVGGWGGVVGVWFFLFFF